MNHENTPVLVIGGACGDSVLTLARLPVRGEDIEATSQGQQIGGCAFNVARTLSRLNVPVINGMPVGNGHWGRIIETQMQQLQLPVLLRNEQMDNGYCMALAEPDGERTFITVTGCEAHIGHQQLASLPVTGHTLIYVSGYELAGDTGAPLRAWLTSLPASQCCLIDPGPRISQLATDFFRHFAHSRSILTLNRDEITVLCGHGDPLVMAQAFAGQQGLTIICRLGGQGAWICQHGQIQHIASYPVAVVDTIGAGDAHCAGLLAGLSGGADLAQAVNLANCVAACVVAGRGAAVTVDWQQLQQRFAICPADYGQPVCAGGY